jgi:hypothetical protein
MKNTETPRHDCGATLQKVMLILDNELPAEEEKALLDEINHCSCCLEKYQIEKAFKEYLCAKIKRHHCTAALANQIRSSLQTNMDR